MNVIEMESTKSCLKSFKDTLLEYSALNFDLLSPAKGFNAEASGDNARVPTFPPSLFDEILEKSKGVLWPIGRKHLMPCIAAKDRFKWSETSFIRFVDVFYGDDLSVFGDSMKTLKCLKVTVCLEDPKADDYFKEISTAADTLEDLELNVHTILTDKSHAARTGACATLALKRLKLNVNQFDWFPYTLDSDKLAVFDLNNCSLSKSFLGTLKKYKHLVHLSFRKCFIDYFSLNDMINAVVSLKGLRYLDLCTTEVTEVMLNNIMRSLESLDILELGKIVFNKSPDLMVIPQRKLKVLNFWQLESFSPTTDVAVHAVLSSLAERVGNFKTFEGLVTIVSTTLVQEWYGEAIGRLYERVHGSSEHLGALLEAEKNGILNFRFPTRPEETFHSRPRSVASCDLLLRLCCHGFLRGDGSRIDPHLKRGIEDFIERNENTHLAKRFSRFLKP